MECADFKRLISSTAIAAAKDDSRPVLTGVQLSLHNNKVIAASAGLKQRNRKEATRLEREAIEQMPVE